MYQYMSEDDLFRFHALLNFWHQVKKVREDFKKVDVPYYSDKSINPLRCTRDGMTGSEAMEIINRLIDEYEDAVFPPLQLEYNDSDE